MLKIKDIDCDISGITEVGDAENNIIYKKLRISFHDEYDRNRDSIPIRELKIRIDKNGEYVIHNHKRMYLENVD